MLKRVPLRLVPLSIFRIQGLGAANAVQVIAMAGFYSVFFFLTLYMQNVLGYSEIKGGSAYLPVTFGVVISSVIASALFSRLGTRPIIVTGAVLASGAVFWLSRISVHGSYLTNLLPPLVLLSLGLGAVFVGVTTAANAGVPPQQAGLAAALINSSTWIGGALGLAIFSAIATARTTHLLAAGRDFKASSRDQNGRQRNIAPEQATAERDEWFAWDLDSQTPRTKGELAGLPLENFIGFDPNLSVSAGEHEIVFRHPQLGERRETTIVKSGVQTRISATLVK